jgi:hypothetical protein
VTATGGTGKEERGEGGQDVGQTLLSTVQKPKVLSSLFPFSLSSSPLHLSLLLLLLSLFLPSLSPPPLLLLSRPSLLLPFALD